MSSFGRPVCSVAEWVPHSVVFASGVDSVCIPLANEGVGLGPSSSGPVASRLPLGIDLLRRSHGDSFHLGVFMRWSSMLGGHASGSSGSQTSRYGLLVYVQGASDSLPHSSPGGEVVASGFWHSGPGVAPGNVPSCWHGCLPGAGSVFVRLYLLRIVSLSLGSCSEVPGPPVLLSSYTARVISCGAGVLSSLSPFRGCLSGSSELGWGSVELLWTSDVRVFFSECTLRPGLGLD